MPGLDTKLSRDEEFPDIAGTSTIAYVLAWSVALLLAAVGLSILAVASFSICVCMTTYKIIIQHKRREERRDPRRPVR